MVFYSPAQTAHSHRQYNAKLGVAAHHAGIGFGRLFQGIGFDHGAYSAQCGKAERVLRIRRCYPGPSLDRFAAPDELRWSELDRLRSYADQNKLAVRTQTANQFG